MVQRLAPEKETEIAIEAIALYNAQHDQKAYLVIAGDGPARLDLEALATSLSAREYVTFLGAVKHSDVPVLYRAADCFVTCSRSETFGLTLAEAIACGTPVAYPACAVFDELYREVLPSAWRYDADGAKGAPAALVGALEVACQSEAKKWVAANPTDFTWERAATDLDAQYADVRPF